MTDSKQDGVPQCPEQPADQTGSNPEAESPMVTAKELQAFVNRLYGGRKPTGVVEEFIAERRREAAEE